MDSCNVSTKGTFKLALRKDRTYTLVFSVPGSGEFDKTFFIHNDCEISVHLPQTGSRGIAIAFSDSGTYTARITSAGDALLRLGEMFENGTMNPRNWRKYQQRYDSLIVAKKDSVLLQQHIASHILSAAYAKDCSIYDSSRIVDMFSKISTSSPLWSYINNALLVMSDCANSFRYAEDVIATHPDPWTRGWLMVVYLPSCARRGDSLRAKNYAKWVLKEFPGTELAGMAKAFAK
jgi:hypothetical protein